MLQIMGKALESLHGSSGIIEQVVELQPNAHLFVIVRSHCVTQAGTDSAGIPASQTSKCWAAEGSHHT